MAFAALSIPAVEIPYRIVPIRCPSAKTGAANSITSVFSFLIFLMPTANADCAHKLTESFRAAAPIFWIAPPCDATTHGTRWLSI